MKRLLTLLVLSVLSIPLFSQNSTPSTILDWKLGDKIDTTGYSKVLVLPYIEYKKDRFNNVDVFTQKTFVAPVNPEMELTKDSILVSLKFQFPVRHYDPEVLLKAFYDKLKVVDGYMFWNHDTDDRFFKNNRDGAFIDIVYKNDYIEVSKLPVEDQ
jgi:hypothetical protein